MNKEINRKAEKMNSKHRLRQRWYKILAVPACIVVFITTYAMILPAITMESTPDAYCGQEEHVHTDACYETPGVPEYVRLDCPLLKEVHIHTEECYDEDGTLTCTEEALPIIHHHDSFCFDDSGELICILPEVTAEDAPEGIVHQHTAECRVIVPAVPPEGLTCTKEEHRHTEDCLDPEKWGLSPDGTAPEQELEPEESDENDPEAPEQETGFKALLEMTGEELYALTQADLLERNDEFMALTEREFESLNEKMAALTATPAPRKAPRRAAPDAASPAGEREVPDLSGVTVSITDNVIAAGQYEVTVTDTGNVLDGHALTYIWYRTKNGGTETLVAKKYYRLNGNVYSNLGDNGESLNLALDDGGLSDDITSVSYHAVLVVDGEKTTVSNIIENTVYNKSVLNGSFEYPMGNQPTNLHSEGTTGLKWRTTASNKKIEIVRLNNNNKSSWFLFYGCNIDGQQVFVYPKTGDQYAEINAEADSALYQSVLTVPGTTMNWRLAHAKRPGEFNNFNTPKPLRPGEKDTMYLCIMPKVMADKEATTTQALRNYVKTLLGEEYTTYNDATQGIYIEKIQDGTTWGTYSGEYTVPNRQYLTSFFFISEWYEGNGVTMGNFLDDVWFAQELPNVEVPVPRVTLTKKLYGELTENELQNLLYKLKFNFYKVDGETKTLEKTVPATSLGSWQQETDDEGNTYYQIFKTVPLDEKWVGKTIEIEEQDAELSGYSLVSSYPDNVFVEKIDTDANVTFTNTYTKNTCQLTVKKFVAPATTADFNFTVSYTGATGEPKTETFSLTNGGEKTITIPIGVSVTIKENNHEGYTVSMKDGNGTQVSGSDTYNFTITQNTTVNIHNTTGVALPETGGASPYFFIYGGMLLMLSSVVTGYLLRRRNGKEGA